MRQDKISFCIASAKDEKEYTKLLLRSLKDHTQLDKHEILVFIDSDNQNTYEALVELQTTIPNMKIYRNTSDFPIGSQRNVTLMFNAASNEVVCYLQSDMVVGKDFDKYILDSLVSDKVMVCGTRVEPPLHPPSPDKHTQNFGLDAVDFDYTSFNNFVHQSQQQDKSDTFEYSVPFALYKKTWLDILGGYDTQFRCSHEDVDSVVRMRLAGIEVKQNWKALVYHFTCVSSRGVDWFKKDAEAAYKNEIQQLASHEEAKRYFRKWGTFDQKVDYRYNVGLSIDVDRYVDVQFIKQIEPYFDIIQIPDSAAVKQVRSQLDFESHYYSNIRWRYTNEYWEQIRHLFNQVDFDSKIVVNSISTDTVLSCRYSDLVRNKEHVFTLLQNLQHIIHGNDVGKYELDPFVIDIQHKNNRVMDLVKCTNLSDVLNAQTVNFI